MAEVSYVNSLGLKKGIYNINGSSDMDYKDDKYKESSIFFTSILQNGEKVKLVQVTSEDEEHYELVLNNELLYYTVTNEKNIESNRIIKSLYQYLKENLNEKNKKINYSTEKIEIIKKYIKED